MRSLKDGLLFHLNSIKSGFIPTILSSNQLIHLYAKNGLLRDAHKLFDQIPQPNVFSWNTIISAYVKSSNLTQAQVLFRAATLKDLVTYNTMLSGYANNQGYETQAISLFLEMQDLPYCCGIDDFTLTTMVNLSAKVSCVNYGRQLHSRMLKTGNDGSVFALSSLIDMYSKCGCFEDALNIFKGCGQLRDLVIKNAMVAACCRKGEVEMALSLFLREPEMNDTIAWNTLISGYVQNGHEKTALNLFVLMKDHEVEYNEHTLANILCACASLKNKRLGKEAHAWILVNGMMSNSFINSGLVDVYCKCGLMNYAESIHFLYGMENSYSVSLMIVGYSIQGKMGEARRLFDSLSEKNAVVWTALFSGYSKSHECESVFDLLREFREIQQLAPNTLILISVLGACALQAFLDPGRQIHGYILRIGIKPNEKMITTMVDMYSKCGHVIYAEKLFRMVKTRDLVLYNVMIAGFAHHGHENEASQLFQMMIDEKVKPDAVTFMAVLSACRHRGLVKLGESYFNSMRNEFDILPESDHYACMIDLYGKANRLEKATELVNSVCVEQDSVILGAYLEACKVNRNWEIAKEVEEKLLRIEGDNGARYVQLANVYAAEGNWSEMGRIRSKMRGNSARKAVGCSWVYVDNQVHAFKSEDIRHSKTANIYSMLAFLAAELCEIAASIARKNDVNEAVVLWQSGAL